MKKLRNLLMATVVGSMTLSLFACGDGEGKATARAKEEFYGVGGVTAVKLLSEEFSAGALSGLSSVQRLAATSEDLSDVKAQAENFHGYLSMLDGFVDEGAIATTVSVNTDEGYDYENKLVITGRDILGSAVSHVMYYSETLLPAEADDDDDDADEIENEYRLTGVLVMDGVAYPMAGARSEEQERGESEAEIYIRAYLNDTDRTTFVEVRQESEVEGNEVEEEYVYSVYRSGRLVEQTAVEFEVENERWGQETEYEVEFLSGEGRGRYAVKRETVAEKVVWKVSYLLNGQRGYFTVAESVNAQGEKVYEYTFADGSTLTFGASASEQAPVNPTAVAA